jgi:uncharacterized protein (DUF934 family)
MKLVDLHNDPWHALGGDDGPPVTITPAPHLLLDLGSWHAVRAHWPAGVRVGVKLPNDQDPADLAADLPRLSLITLHFPKWTDGRAYSQAHLLRVRLKFGGELRAVGDVVADMMPLLHRTGFDAVVLRADQRPEVARSAMGYFDAFYQADAIARGGEWGNRAG